MNEISDIAPQLVKVCILYCPAVPGSPVNGCGPIGLEAAGDFILAGSQFVLSEEESIAMADLETEFLDAISKLEGRYQDIEVSPDWDAVETMTLGAVDAYMPGDTELVSIVEHGSGSSLLAEAGRRYEDCPSLGKPERACCIFLLDHILASLKSDSATYRKLHARLFSQMIGKSVKPEDLSESVWLDGLLVVQLFGISDAYSEHRELENVLNILDEAAGYWRSLADISPEHFAHYLASCLSRLSNVAQDLGQQEEALEAMIELTEILRYLAQQAPDNHTAYLAQHLTKLSERHGSLGQMREALTTAVEAVSISRSLFKRDPDGNRLILAGSLLALGNALIASNQSERSLPLLEESAALWRVQRQSSPIEMLYQFCECLRTLAQAAENCHGPEAALAPLEEAIDLCRQLVSVEPDDYQPALAIILNDYAIVLCDLQRLETARTIIGEGVKIHRSLTVRFPETFDNDLARSLTNSSGIYAYLDDLTSALRDIDEAISIRDTLRNSGAELVAPELALSYAHKGTILFEKNLVSKAKTAFISCLETLSIPYENMPDQFAETALDYVKSYTEICNADQTEPDPNLLAPYIRGLERAGLM